MKNKKILVIAAHPDDEILGCGGMIKKYSSNNEINCLILGEGITSRYTNRDEAPVTEINELRQKAIQVSNAIGIKRLIHHHLPDNRFDSIDFLDIVKLIEKEINVFKPEIIFTHSNADLNIDHRITFQAVLTATRPNLTSSIKEIYSFETPSSTEWAFGKINGIFNPNMFIDISDTINDKIEALKIYDTEINPFPHPRSAEALKAIAMRWGSVSGLQYAEAFETIKIIKP